MPLNALPRTIKNRNGPQPLRLPPGKLFFGYEIKPLKNKDGQAEADAEQKQHFQGEGQSLRKKK
jgi:ubiquitin fusion degradation protein 1